MPQYDGAIRIDTSIITKNIRPKVQEIVKSLEEIGKDAEKAREKLDLLDQAGVSHTSEEYKAARAELQKYVDSYKDSMYKIAEYGQGVSDTLQFDTSKIDAAREKLESLDASGIDKSSKEYKSAERDLNHLIDAHEQYQEIIDEFDSYTRTAFEGFKELRNETEKYINISDTQSEKTDENSQHLNILRINVEEYAKALKELHDQGKFYGDEDFNEVYIAWKNAEDAVKAYKSELNKQTESGQAKIAEQEAKAAEKREAAQRRIEEQAEKALQKENARIQKESENEAKLQAKTAEREAKIRAMAAEEQRLAQIRENAVVSNQRIVQTVERIRQLEQEIADLKKINVTEGHEDYDSRLRELSTLKAEVRNYTANINKTKDSYKKLGSIAQRAFAVTQNAISKTVSGIKKFSGFVKSAFSRLNRSAGKSKGMLGSLASRFKGLALSLLIFNQISKAFNAMASGIKEGFSNLYKENQKFKNSIDSLKASANTLKNAFATAFKPLVDIAIPYIQKAIDYLTILADKFAQILAAITGQKTYTKAIKQTTAAIKEQTKAQNKQLSSLDKLNNLTTSSTGSSSESGSGTMFEESVPISLESLNISEWIKDMWENSDFTEMGEFLGNHLKNGLDSINWEETKEKAQNVAKDLASLINGFVQTEGLPESLGKTIGNAVNTGVAAAKTFFEETEFDELGKSVALTANAAMEETNWEELAETISLGIESALDMAIGFLDEFDWEKFTESIEEFLTGIDWGGIFGRLGLLLLELLRGAFTIGNKLGADMTSALADFFRSIGWDSVAGFFDGLSEKIKKQGERVKLMFQIIIDWVKEKLGIHSPSTVFSDIGKNLVQGLMNGLAGLKEKVLKIFNSVKNAVKTPINMILGFVESLANGIIKAINFAIGALNNLSITVPDWLKYVPGLSDIAGKKFGFNIPELEQVSIPRLATGTVVPPNREFMAVLGDNKREPEIVSPVSTMKQAVLDAILEAGGIGTQGGETNLHLTVECEGYQLISLIQKLDREYYKQAQRHILA